MPLDEVIKDCLPFLALLIVLLGCFSGASLLSKGSILGWVQGSYELGLRALVARADESVGLQPVQDLQKPMYELLKSFGVRPPLRCYVTYSLVSMGVVL